MTTATKIQSVRDANNGGDLGRMCTGLEMQKLGDVLSPIKVVATAINTPVGLSAIDITSAAFLACCSGLLGSHAGIALKTGEMLPAIGRVVTCRVTVVPGGGGTADVGDRKITDAGGVVLAKGAQPFGRVKLSNDGKTLTFEGLLTGLTLTYYPRPAVGSDHAIDAAT
jgi:hypothetical protein